MERLAEKQKIDTALAEGGRVMDAMPLKHLEDVSDTNVGHRFLSSRRGGGYATESVSAILAT